MLFQTPTLALYVRIVAVLTLLLGLSDAGRLLGVGSGSVSPVSVMGFSAFAYLGVFSLARLFAAVGLWIKSSWGAVLLVAATAVELLLFIIGSPDVRMSAFGFAMRVVLLASIIMILGLSLRFRRAQAE